MDQYYVYILSNKRHTVFYTGITNNLIRRIFEHKEKLVKGFTKRYNLDQLVYVEILKDPKNAIQREKQLKDFRRVRKLELIRSCNPLFLDLYQNFL